MKTQKYLVKPYFHLNIFFSGMSDLQSMGHVHPEIATNIAQHLYVTMSHHSVNRLDAPAWKGKNGAARNETRGSCEAHSEDLK